MLRRVLHFLRGDLSPASPHPVPLYHQRISILPLYFALIVIKRPVHRISSEIGTVHLDRR